MSNTNSIAPTQDTLDDGIKSRKLWLSIFCMCLIFAGAVLAHKVPEISALYPTLVGGLLAAAGLYHSANLMHRYLNNQIPFQNQGDDDSKK
ncbi:MAG: hypothetical protein KGO96_07380 [Elusimicrobia bacterium]|nr:hypothetical protein [Elusimicrobiota bacterium]